MRKDRYLYVRTVVGGNTNYKEWVTSNFSPAKDRLWRQHGSRYKNTTKAGKEGWKKSEGGDRGTQKEGMRLMG